MPRLEQASKVTPSSPTCIGLPYRFHELACMSGYSSLEGIKMVDKEWFHFGIKKGWTIVILRAGEGKATLAFSPSVGPEGLIVSLEPVVESYRQLVAKVAKHRLTNVIPLMAAIWSRTGPGLINIHNIAAGHSILWKRKRGKRRIHCTTWDHLMDVLQLRHVDYVKCDVEGSENEFLNGMNKVLPDRVIIEEHLRYCRDPEKTLNEIYSLLKKKGYTYSKRGIYIFAKRV